MRGGIVTKPFPILKLEAPDGTQEEWISPSVNRRVVSSSLTCGANCEKRTSRWRPFLLYWDTVPLNMLTGGRRVTSRSISCGAGRCSRSRRCCRWRRGRGGWIGSDYTGLIDIERCNDREYSAYDHEDRQHGNKR